MAVARRAAGAAATGTTSVSPAWPTNSVGDIALLAVASTGTVTTPSGWTLIGSSTSTTSAHIYVFWQAITTVKSGTQAVTTSATAAGQITTYSGADTFNAPGGVAATRTTTTAATVASGSTVFAGGYAYLAVTTSTTTTLSAEASTAGSWVPSEAVDNSTTKSLAVVDGAITAGTTTTLTATSSANSSNAVITVPLVPSFSASPALSGSGALGTTGGNPNVQTLALTGNGSQNVGWTAEGPTEPDYTNLLTNDGATSKMYSVSAGDIRSYTLADLTGSVSVNSVTVHTVVLKLDPVSATTRAVLVIGGTVYESTDLTPSTNNVWEDLSYTWATNPATGAAWTVAAVNALEVGVKKTNAAGERVTQITVDVDAPAAAVTFSASPALSGSGTLSASTAPAFTAPADPGAVPGLRMRIQPSTLALNNGDSVASISGGGSGLTLTQATPANQPTFLASGANGKPALHYPSTGSTSLAGTGTAFSSTELTFVFIVDLLSGAGAQEPFYSSDAEVMINVLNSTDGWEVWSGAMAGVGSQPAAGLQVYIGTINSTGKGDIWVNGTLVSTGKSTQTTTGWPSGSMILGARDAVGQRQFRGDIYEMFVFDHALTAQQRVTLDSYAATQYGVTVADGTPLPTFTGSGSLAATGSVGASTSFTASPALSGAGTLSTTQVPKPAQSVALSGTGGLLAGAVPNPAIAPAFNGTGTLATTSVPKATGTVALSGAGTLTPGVGAPSPTGSASLSGAGTLASAATVRTSGTAALSGSGSLSGTASPQASQSVALSGSGALSSTAAPAIATVVNLSGSGALSGAVTESHSDTAALTGAGSLSAVTSPSLPRTAAFTGSGSLTGKLITTLKNDFDNAFNSTDPITTGSSALSGEDGFDVVNTGTLGTTANYTNAVTLRPGGLAARFAYADFDTGYLQWNLSPVTATSRTVVRAYVQFGVAAAGTTEQFVYVRNSAGQITQVGLNSTGRWIATAKAGVTIGTAPANVTPVINTWYRIEVAVTPGVDATSGVAEIAVYQGHSLTPIWTITNNALDLGTTPVQAVRFGRSLTTANARQHWFDDVAANANYPAGFLGPTVWPIDLTGSGSLSTVATPSSSAAIALSGSGTLAGNATGFSGTATFTGTGSLSAGTASPQVAAAIALSGSGSLAASGAPTTSATVPLSGSGSLAATTAPRPAATVGLSGSGTLAATGIAKPQGTASLSGSGTLAASGTPRTSATAALTGSGSLSATGSATQQGSASVGFNGSGTLTLVSRAGTKATVSLTGSGSLTVLATPAESASSTFTGSGSLAATGGPRVAHTVAFTGSGSLAAAGANAAVDLSTFTGAGTLVAIGSGQRSLRDTDLLVASLTTRDLGIGLHGHPVAATTRGTPVSVTAHARDLPVTLHGDPVTAKASL